MSSLIPQIHPEYESFLKALKKIADYAVDMADSERHSLTDGVTYGFSRDEFFDHLYVPRPQETQIREELNVVSNFLVIVGGRGSGKTTLALKIERDLSPSSSYGYFVTYIDVRTRVLRSFAHSLTDSPEQHSPGSKENSAAGESVSDTVITELMDKIKNRYLNELFPNPNPDTLTADTPNKRLQLIAFLLNSHNGMPETYDFLTNLQFTASQLFTQYKLAMPEERKNMKMYDWILHTSFLDPRVADLVEKMHKVITPSMVAHAAREIYGIRHQVIWIDNLDILTERNQGIVQYITKNLYARINNIASVIISLREQNIFRDYDLDEPGAPPVRTEVRLYTTEHDVVAAHELGHIHDETMHALISKRLIFAREMHSRQLDHVQTRLTEAQTNLNRPGIDEHDRTVLDLVARQLQAELTTLGPKITDERFFHCQKLSSALVDQFLRHKVVYFCNGDIRQILNIHVDSLAYLLSRPQLDQTSRSRGEPSDIPMALSYNPSQISTLFLTRLRDRDTGGDEHPISAYDIIRNMNAWYSNNQQNLGCFLEYLIITATWNLTLGKRGIVDKTSEIPTIASLISVLSRLDYTREEILNALAGLYDSRNRVGLIEIQSPDTSHISDVSQIKEGDLVHVTPRGKCLVANLSNTFGYTYACLRRQSQARNDSWHPAIDTVNALQELMPALCDLAQMHLTTLKAIRDKGRFGSKGWLDRYRSLFGTPVLEFMTRRSLLTTGKIVTPARRALQFEILLPGIIQHAPEDKSKRDLDLLLRVFNSALYDIENFKGSSIPSFRELLEISERDED